MHRRLGLRYTEPSADRPKTPPGVALPHCGSGGIGRRAGFRSQWDLVPWGFKSPLPHHCSSHRPYREDHRRLVTAGTWPRRSVGSPRPGPHRPGTDHTRRWRFRTCQNQGHCSTQAYRPHCRDRTAEQLHARRTAGNYRTNRSWPGSQPADDVGRCICWRPDLLRISRCAGRCTDPRVDRQGMPGATGASNRPVRVHHPANGDGK